MRHNFFFQLCPSLTHRGLEEMFTPVFLQHTEAMLAVSLSHSEDMLPLSLSLSNTQTRWKTLSSSNNLLFLLIISHSFLFLPFHIILLHLSLHRFPSVSSSSSYLFPTLPFLTKKKKKEEKKCLFFLFYSCSRFFCTRLFRV